MPYSSFFSFGGTLPPSAPSYIVRRADNELWQTVLDRNYALILDSRQKGKSSLIGRISKRLESENYRNIKIDLQRYGSNLTEEQWYATLLFSCAEQLGESDQARALWTTTPNSSPSSRWIDFLESAVKEGDAPLVVWIDEIDFVRSLKFDTDDFFAAIRSSYSRRTDHPILKNLIFCFSGACTPVGLVRNPDRGQVIVGRRIQLDDFALSDLEPYRKELSEDEALGKELIESVYSWTSGHPYLTQLACNEWKRRADRGETGTIDDFFSEQLSTVGNRHQNDHLLAISNLLLNPTIPHYHGEEARTRVLRALQALQSKAAWRGRRALEQEVQDYLAIAGVITERGGKAQIRNRIYAEAFNAHWIRDHLPDAETQRQRRAVLKAVALSVLIFGTITIGLSLLVVQNVRLNHDLRETLTLASNSERRALNEAYVGGMQSVSAEISDGNFSRAATILETLKDSEYRGWEWDYVHAKISQHLRQFPTNGTICNFDFYPSGNLRSMAGSEGFTTLDETGAMKFEFRLPKEYAGNHESHDRLWSTGPVDTYLLTAPESPKLIKGRVQGELNGRLVLSRGNETELILVDAKGQQVGLPVSCNPGRTLLLPTGNRAVFRDARYLTEIDFTLGKVVHRYPHSGHINQFLVDQTPGIAYLASDDPEILKVNYRANQRLVTYKGNQGPVYTIAFSPDGKWLVSGGADAIVRRFNAQTGELVAEYVGHRDRIQKVRFSPDGKTIWSSSFDETIREWALEPQTNPTVYADGTLRTGKLRVDAQSGSFLLGFETGKAIWYQTGLFPSVIDLGGEPYAQGEFIDENTVILATEPGTIIVRDQKTVRRTKIAVNSRIRQITRPDGEGNCYLALQSGELIKLNTKTLKHSTLKHPGGSFRSLGLSNNGKWLVQGNFDSWVQVIETATGKVVFSEKLATNGALGVGFNPDDSLIGLACGNGDIVLLEPQNNFAARTLQGHTSRVWRVCFSPDGSQLASCSFDNTAKIWDVATGKILFNLKHKSWVGDTAFSPDGKRLLTACGDGASRLWSVATGRELLVLDRGPNPLFSTRFCDFGRSVVTTDSLGRVLLFTTPTKKLESPDFAPSR